jgi:methionyl-tRNA formyltransferase
VTSEAGAGPAAPGGLVFLGSPPAAVPTLEALVRAGHRVALVVSQPDRRRGRGSSLEASPVKTAALSLGLPVTDQLADATGVGAQLGVVAAYGRIIPVSILDELPMVNVHFSLLPRWRGAAPVERAILAGDEWTGVCIMRVEAGLDTGPVLARAEVAIGAEETAAALTGRLAELGAALAVDVLEPGPTSLPPGEPQQGEPTYAAKIDPAELRIDWSSSAEHIARLVRLGRAWSTFHGERVRILATRPEPDRSDITGDGAPGTLDGDLVRTGRGWVRLLEVQPAGRRPVDADDWRRGVRPATGERFGDDAPPDNAPPGDSAGDDVPAPDDVGPTDGSGRRRR